MEFPKRKNPRLPDFDYTSSHVYFLTFNTLQKKPLFIRSDFVLAMIECLKDTRIRFDAKVLVYCVMPDHVHLLIQPSGKGASVSDFVGAFKSRITVIKREFGIAEKLWQPRFYDHVLRREEDVAEVAKYILNNPVRRGLVDTYEEYAFCGYLDGLV